MSQQPSGDPGWGKALRRVWPALILPFPHMSMLLARKEDGLTRLRAVFLSFALMPVSVGIVTWLISRDLEPESGESAVPWIVVCVAVGLSEVAMIAFSTRRRSLMPADKPGADDAVTIGSTYRGLTMIGASLSLAAFLMGFVATFIVHRAEMIFIGVPFMAAGLLLSAPTAADLARRQRELRLGGSSVDLVEVVKTAPWGRS